LAALAGISCCPEGGAVVAAAAELRRQGWLGAHERVVLFNTGGASKYPDSLRAALSGG
jgi:threonine synthase